MADFTNGAEIYLTTPRLVHKIWGSETLAKEKGGTGRVGESLEVSLLKGEESLIGNRPLSDFFNNKEIPYLIKILSAEETLSVQVHPHTEYARKVENSVGKTECWVVMKSTQGGGIYLGFEKDVTKDDFKKALLRKQDVTPFLRFYPVFEGDFFYVPAGAIHAIGKGVLLCEVQESSGITYRVFDWNRLDEKGKERELHIEKALDVINFDSSFNSEENFKIRRDLFEESQLRIDLAHHPSFEVELVRLRAGEVREFVVLKRERVQSIVLLSGEVDLVAPNQKERLNERRSAILGHNIATLKIFAQKESHFLWVK